MFELLLLTSFLLIFIGQMLPSAENLPEGKISTAPASKTDDRRLTAAGNHLHLKAKEKKKQPCRRKSDRAAI